MKKVKLIALLLVIALMANMIMPLMTAIAVGTAYTITFEVAEGGTHTLDVEGGHLKIDGQFVDLRSDPNDPNSTIGTVTKVSDSKATITVEDGTKGVLNYNSADQFTLYNNDAQHVMGTEIETDTTILIKNYKQPQQQPQVIIEFESNDISNNTVTYTIDGKPATLKVNGANISNNNGHNEVRVDENKINQVSFTIGGEYNSQTMQVIVRGANGYDYVLDVDSSNSANLNGVDLTKGGFHISIEHKPGSETIPGGSGEIEQPNENYGDIAVNVTFNNTRGEVQINGTRVTGDAGEVASYNGTAEKVGYTNSANKNTITIQTAFGEKIPGKVTINGEDYTINDKDINTFEVAGATSYTIVVNGKVDPNRPRTIIWANPNYVPKDAEDAEWAKSFTLKNGKAEVVKVYDDKNKELSPSEYINEGAENNGLKAGFGWVKVYRGYKVVFKFVPDYGYQLTNITLNEIPMTAESTMNYFTVAIPDDENADNIHFAATFTKTEDVVQTPSNKVSSGGIELGNTLDGGSAQLTVNDVTLSADKIQGFEGAVNGYSVSNYLDIDLYNVYYKGKNDSNDVWKNQINNLTNKATITLQLAEGIDANDIVIVHNVNNGSTYEVIEIDSYDATTRTITFKTNSFSNYAIASRTVTHNLIKVERTEATCAKEGNIEYYRCTDEGCGKCFKDASGNVIISESNTIIPVNNNHITLNKVEKVNATCEEDGHNEYYRCSACSKIFKDASGNVATTTEEEKIEKTGHDWTEWVITKEATTTETGLKNRTCKNNSAHKEEQIIPKISSGEPTIKPDPTPIPEPTPEINVEPENKTEESTQATEETRTLINKVIAGNYVEGMSDGLKEAIKEAVNNGKTIKVEVLMPEVKEENIKEDTKKIKEVIGTVANVAKYYDIDIAILIDERKQDETVTKLDNKIKLSLPMPTELPEVAEGYERVYTIVRVHNGVTEALETKIENGKITFESDKFSTYAVTYQDKKIEEKNETDNNNENPESNSTNENNTESTTPKTGDNIYIYIGLMVFSTIGILVTSKSMKRKR